MQCFASTVPFTFSSSSDFLLWSIHELALEGKECVDLFLLFFFGLVAAFSFSLSISFFSFAFCVNGIVCCDPL